MLLAMLGFAVIPDRISIDILGLPIPKAIAEVARISNQPLLASPDLSIDIVCIKATDVPLEELKDQIAKTIGAEWVNREGRQFLTRSKGLERMQDQEEIEAKSREISAIIAAMPELPKFTEPEATALVQQAQTLVDQMHPVYVTEETQKALTSLLALVDKAPAKRMLDRILPGLDPKLLAAVRPGQAVVFSSKPTKKQHPLPRRLVEQVTREYETEQGIFRRMMLRFNTSQFRKPNDARFWSWESDPQFHKIFIKIELNRATGMPRITMKLADKSNQTQSVTSTLLRRSSTQVAPVRKWEGEIDLTPQALEWKRLFYRLISTSAVDQFTSKPMTQILAPWLDPHCNPETAEPLSFAAGVAMHSFADSQSKNIIACLPDQALVWYDGDTSKMTAQSFANHAESKWNGRFDVNGSWLTYRPVYLSEGRRYRIDREALGQLFRATRAHRGLTINESAKYAYAVSSPLLFESWDRTVTAYGERFDGEYSTRDLVDWFNRGALRLLGALSSIQRNTLLSGGSVPYASLSSSARDELQSFTFGDQKSTRGLLGRLYWAREELNAAEIRGTLDHEATEVFGSGIPADTVIRGLAQPKDMLVQSFLGESPFTQTFSPLTLGEYLADQNDEGNLTKFEYQLGSANHFTLTVDYGLSRTSHDEFSEVSPGKRTTFSDWVKFPAAIKNQIENSMKAIRDRRSKQENQSGAIPPP